MSTRTQEVDTTTRPHICWLGGWGIAPETMHSIVCRLLPSASHYVLPPTAASIETLREQLMGHAQKKLSAAPVPNIIAGYSTGAFLLLRDFANVLPQQAEGTQLLLLAPFADFRMESNLGGKVASTRLKLLLRRLRNDPLAAVADFYLQSGIDLPAPEALPYAQADLIWGIEQLAQSALCEENLLKLKNNSFSLKTSAFIGTQDALLNAEQIADLFAPGVCRIAQSASHDLSSLLQAAIAEGGLPR